MRFSVHPENPEKRKIKQLAEILNDGGVIIYPTDTVYGIGCSLYDKNAIERLCKIKNIQPKKALFSVLTDSLSRLSLLTKSINTSTYRFIKSHTPGAYTFILEASKEVPHYFNNKRKTIGVRYPDNQICIDLMFESGIPLVNTSLPEVDNVEEYTDPDLIYEIFGHQVDAVIDGGPGGIEPSTIIDCTQNQLSIIREGKGEIDF